MFVKEKPYRISFYLGYKVVLRGKKNIQIESNNFKILFLLYILHILLHCSLSLSRVCMHVCMHVSMYTSSDGTQDLAYSRQTLYYFAMLPALLQILLFFMLYIKSFKLSAEDDMT